MPSIEQGKRKRGFVAAALLGDSLALGVASTSILYLGFRLDGEFIFFIRTKKTEPKETRPWRFLILLN